jgi:hypothetical protein
MTPDEGMGTTTSRGTHGKAVGKEEMNVFNLRLALSAQHPTANRGGDR